MRKMSLFLFALPLFLWGGTLADNTPDTEIIRPWDLQLEGTMGDLGITFLLNKINAQNVAFSGDCFEVTGDYKYKNHLHPILLEGKVCPADEEFIMWHDKGGENEEKFEGKLKGFLKSWEGKWTKGKESQKFKMVESEFMAGEASRAPFMAKIHEDLGLGEPGDESGEIDESMADVENAYCHSAGIDKTGGYIRNIQYGWNGSLEFFSCTRLQYAVTYTSTARSSYDQYTYQLLMQDGDLFVAVLHQDMDYDKVDNMEFSGYAIDVYRWQDENWEYATEDVFPRGFPNTKMFEKDVFLDIDISYDRLRLDWDGEKRLFKWNGRSFYL